jgi:hypothetical protein
MAKTPTTAATDNANATGSAADQSSEIEAPICGIIRPIAAMGDIYPATHWLEVHEVVSEAASEAGFRLRLVSESDRAGIIVSDIIQNLYTDPIVICDVSGRNPNVMFELGMRITFQKPVIVITDDATPFTFDISAIRHIAYRRDLRLQPTRKFQSDLARAISATLDASADEQQRNYLQQFGPVEVTELASRQVGIGDLAKEIQELRRAVTHLQGDIGGPGARRADRSVKSRDEPDLLVEVSTNHEGRVVQTITSSNAAKVQEVNYSPNGETVRLTLRFSSDRLGSMLGRSALLLDIKAMDEAAQYYPLTTVATDALRGAGIGASMFMGSDW